ncbi:MAG: hypothetical protein H8K04_01750 [Nitrospira sp.]
MRRRNHLLYVLMLAISVAGFSSRAEGSLGPYEAKGAELNHKQMPQQASDDSSRLDTQQQGAGDVFEKVNSKALRKSPVVSPSREQRNPEGKVRFRARGQAPAPQSPSRVSGDPEPAP